MAVTLLPLTGGLAACGLEVAGQLREDDGGALPDAPIVVPDAGADVLVPDAAPDVALDAPFDAGPDVVDAGCPVNACANVPGGWNPVAYKDGTKTCPAGTTGLAYATKPTPSGGACACGCTLQTAPVCDVGTTQTSFSVNPNSTCASLGLTHTFATSGQCLAVNGGFSDNYATTALPRSGGACTGAPAAGTATATDVALCTPNVCKEAICANVVPAGYKSCIETPGDTTCPSNTPYTKLVTVGDTPGVSCSNGCGCNVTGTCSSPKITYFTDTNCATVAQSFVANGTCQAVTFGGTLRGVSYQATVQNPGCAPTGSSVATGTLQNRHTVCCRP